MLDGSCLCGAVRYQLEGELGPIVCCHCSMCRKAQGTAFATNAPVEAARFHITRGEQALRAYPSSPGKWRCFCSICGSPLFSKTERDPGTIRLRI
ncbi:MAG TPA: GFA family protein, partial [Anaeromyxobacteraceae bacterium]|nr:GFA family protein [Anaeromyxobacteraceae bacterium]